MKMNWPGRHRLEQQSSWLYAQRPRKAILILTYSRQPSTLIWVTLDSHHRTDPGRGGGGRRGGGVLIFCAHCTSPLGRLIAHKSTEAGCNAVPLNKKKEESVVHLHSSFIRVAVHYYTLDHGSWY